MNSKKWVKILANFVLLISFALTYFLDFTGLDLHQYLGVVAAGILIVHIITHWDWLKNIFARFLNKLNGRLRFYFLLDLLILVAITLITISGILISTWLEPNNLDYLRLRSIHIVSSIGGLTLLILKLAFHWKYFLKTFSSFRFSPRNDPVPISEPLSAHTQPLYSRRDALKTIGIISTVGIFGLFKAASAMSFLKTESLPDPKVETTDSDPNEEIITTDSTIEPLPTGAPIAQVVQPNGGQKRDRKHGSAPNGSTIQPTPGMVLPQPTLEPNSDEIQSEPINPSESIQNCIVRCDRRCAFPGACRRYIDLNNNGLCDLGECYPV